MEQSAHVSLATAAMVGRGEPYGRCPVAIASVVSAPAPSADVPVVPAAAPSAATSAVTAPSTTDAWVIALLTPAPTATASVVPTSSTVDELFHVVVRPPPVLLEHKAEEHHWFIEALTSDPVPSFKQNPLSMLLQQSIPLQAKHEAEFIHQEYQLQIRKLRDFFLVTSLLQMLVPVKEDELPRTLSIRCLMNFLTTKPRCFSFPLSHSWDAVLYRQHRLWPPPVQMELHSTGI